MINGATGEVSFRSGLFIAPHGRVAELVARADAGTGPKVQSQTLSLKGWKRHVLGFHDSEHGVFEVEALSSGDRFQVVLLAHQHVAYKRNTPEDADRSAFHDGVIHSDLVGQREFSWGEVRHHLERAPNKDWLVIAYSHEARIPMADRRGVLYRQAHEKIAQADLHRA